ncbi:MAG TPA: HAD family hydrolase [Candidatus Saccharimonadales bacterium]|nr:HAD family hydrolase [Candidatus Saccharimonadales bacterium]
MGDVRLVITDIDCTLVAERAPDATPAVHAAMRAVQAKGILVVAATSRPYEMARDLFLKLGFTGPSIFDGGASIRDVTTSELLWQNWLELPRLQAIARLVFPRAELVDFFPYFQYVSATEIKPEDLTEAAPYGWALVPKDSLAQITAELAKLPNLNVHPGVGWPEKPDQMDIQITDENSDKFHAVNALRELLHISRQETLAIGDGDNDIPLFKNAGLKLAMGNAIPELKAMADYVVGSVDEDGWAEAMHRFVLS